MSESRTNIFVEFPEELQQLFNDNDLTVREILSQHGIQVDITYGILPDEQDVDSRSKDPVLIILAGGATAMGIGLAISKVLHTLQRKPYLVEYYELVEIRDSKGNILLDKNGKPRLKRIKKYDLLEPRKEDNKQSIEINLDPTNGLIIKFGSIEKQSETRNKPSKV